VIHHDVSEDMIHKNPIKIAIIGAGRNRNGIGSYIARYFKKNGADVVSVLGTTQKSAEKAAAALIPWGINAAPYTDFQAMIGKEQLNAIAIAAPMESHHGYLINALKAGLHVFCEKPFVWPTPVDISALMTPLFAMADTQGLKLAMNSQWPFSLPDYEALCGPVVPQVCEAFSIRLSPVVRGKEMILDSVPHALSLLYAVFSDGRLAGMRMDAEAEKMTIQFQYCHSAGSCAAEIHLVHTPHQPRDFSYGFNGKTVYRLLDLDDYDIFFTHEGSKMQIKDPLDLSIRDFLTAVAEDRKPRIGSSHIINNMNLLKEIYDFS
jgi:GFO/IDH/MocA oxidoreductase family protein